LSKQQIPEAEKQNKNKMFANHNCPGPSFTWWYPGGAKAPLNKTVSNSNLHRAATELTHYYKDNTIEPSQAW